MALRPGLLTFLPPFLPQLRNKGMWCVLEVSLLDLGVGKRCVASSAPTPPQAPISPASPRCAASAVTRTFPGHCRPVGSPQSG